ncbi:hypothetical protein CYMTET_25256 [Cymbomonas tetramitiformis]|uniref:Chromo domain-containing protein n=1 Tax=Cymbomonas tetramitiformis TaxID=36881 RepID=A0AAE0FU59_9CHLO|nr:hypothetical protein CYMTET_25256 [Cymbomonas tetramitiformis]
MPSRGAGAKRTRSSSNNAPLIPQGKGPVKRTQLHPYDAAGSDNTTYEVEHILAARTRYGEPQWLIRWKGLTEISDTWEPLRNIPGSEADVEAFKDKQAREQDEIAKKTMEEEEKRRKDAAQEVQDHVGFEAPGDNIRSGYWKYFKVKKDGSKIVEYVCKLCGPNAIPKAYCGNTSNLRTHLAHCHKDIAVDMKQQALLDSAGESSVDTKPKAIDAMIPQASSEQSNRLHRAITLWLARRGRPLTLPEKDSEFRDIFDEIFRGAYVPPSYHTVIDNMLALSAEGRVKVSEALKSLRSEGINPSIGGDIWSEGGIAIFGVLAYFISEDFVFREKLVGAIPFSDVRHTADELESATKTACAGIGIGEYRDSPGPGEEVDTFELVDTVSENIHVTCSDNASNIVSGWTCFDGHECVAHTIALVVHTYLNQVAVKKVFGKLRGMTGHFNHSVIGCKLLYDCQKRSALDQSKSPQDNDTRSGWGGGCKQATWYVTNKDAVRLYDVERPVKASTAVPNTDGSVYKDHQLADIEWDIVRESMYILQYAASAVDFLQGTQYPTSCLVLPLIGKLVHISRSTTKIKHAERPIQVLNEDVKQARELMHKALADRYFCDMMDCKLEDFAVATILDPRHKSFKFKEATGWMRGKLTLEKAEGWARKAWEMDWKPKPSPVNGYVGSAVKKARTKAGPIITVASFLADSDDEEEDTSSHGDVAAASHVAAEDEFKQYLAYPDAPASTEVLTWWKGVSEKLPNMARMARQFLGAPATTAGAERAFSAVGAMHSDLRK